MAVSAAKGGSCYGGAMLSALFRWLAIVSFVLMPLGMSATPAAAAEHEAAAASTSCAGHEQPSTPTPDSKTHCTSCVALAVPQSVAATREPQPVPVLVDRDARLLLGLQPEVATPPPKRA